MVQYLIDEYGLRGALLFNAGIMLNVLPCAAVVFPRTAKKYAESSSVIKESRGKAPPLDTHNIYVIDEAIDTANNSLSFVDKFGKVVEKLWKLVCADLKDCSHVSFLRFQGMVFLEMLGISIYFTYNVEFAVLRGVSTDDAAILVSVFGMSGLLGRMMSGVPQIRRWNSLLLFAATVFLITVFNFFLIFAHSFLVISVLASLYGISYGINAVQWAICAADILEPSKMAKVFGYSNMFTGLGMLTGPPLAGLLCDSLGEITAAFYLSSIFLGISFIFCVWQYWSRRHHAPRLTMHLAESDTNDLKDVKPKLQGSDIRGVDDVEVVVDGVDTTAGKKVRDEATPMILQLARSSHSDLHTLA